jgi:membrane-associated phospholipid phosphatase
MSTMRNRVANELLSPRAPWLPLLLFVAATVLTEVGAPDGLDKAVAAILPPDSTLVLALIWPPIVFLFSAGISFVIFLAIVLFLQRHDRALALMLLLAFIAGSLIELALKHSLVHPGPPVAFGLLHIDVPEAGLQRLILGRLGMVNAGGMVVNSYPSGHSLRSLLIAVALVWTFPRHAVRVVAVVFAVATPAVLIAARVHWLSDVIGGLLLGWGLSALAAYLAARVRTSERLPTILVSR